MLSLVSSPFCWDTEMRNHPFTWISWIKPVFDHCARYIGTVFPLGGSLGLYKYRSLKNVLFLPLFSLSALGFFMYSCCAWNHLPPSLLSVYVSHTLHFHLNIVISEKSLSTCTPAHRVSCPTKATLCKLLFYCLALSMICKALFV